MPLRATAIDQMARSTFRSPCQINDIHIAVADVSFNPLMHKGALLRVSPEEVTGAIVFAIAREIWPWKQLFCRVVPGACLAPKLVPSSVDMSDKGVLQVVWALFSCDGNRQLLK